MRQPATPPIPIVRNPIELFRTWFHDAHEQDPKYHDSVALATVDESGMPDVRIVLLKNVRDDGFVFFTNLNSAKGRHLAANPAAAMCFYWKPLDRQVRVRGTVVPVSDAESDAYFATRARTSQLGAWASWQSDTISSRAVLEDRLHEIESKFTGTQVPRPPHWAGLCLQPVSIEFWKEGPFRLHDRLLYEFRDGSWHHRVLSP